MVPTVVIQDSILTQLQISAVEFFWGFGLAVLRRSSESALEGVLESRDVCPSARARE
jgi:hypothetical protein